MRPTVPRPGGKVLLEKWDTRYLLITLGEHGMMLFERDDSSHHIPTRAQQVFDVSGAGDTAIALFTLALVWIHSPEIDIGDFHFSSGTNDLHDLPGNEFEVRS